MMASMTKPCFVGWPWSRTPTSWKAMSAEGPDAIAYDDFTTHVAKYVRAKHVNTSQHWMTAEIVPNELVD